MKYAKWPTFLLSFRQIILSVNSDVKTEKRPLFHTLTDALQDGRYCRRHLHNFFQKVAVLTAMKNRGNAQGDSQHLTVTCSHFFTFLKLFRKPANISVAASSVILPATMSAFSFSHSSLASCSAAKISSLVWVK